jgi:hypothetical protein
VFGISGVLPFDSAKARRARNKYAGYSADAIDAVNKIQEHRERLPVIKRGRRRWSQTFFPGIMNDPGTNISTHGREQRIAYEQFIGSPTNFQPAVGKVASLGGKTQALGKVTFSMPVGESVATFMSQETDGDAPILLGAFDLSRMDLSLDTCTSTLRGNGNIIPLSFDRGDWFLSWVGPVTESLFTEQELVKLHCRFGHPGSQKLYDFLGRASPDDCDEITRDALEKIAQRCRSCESTRPAPRIFKARIPHDGALFNSEILVDLFVLDRRPVFSVVCRDTRFQSAMFLQDGTKAIDVWHALLRCWIYRFSGAPDSIRHDVGVQFMAQEFQTLAGEMGIRCQPIPVESPHSLGIGERYHGALRRIFERLRVAHPEASSELLLDASVKAANDLMGPDGLVPTLLIFGVYPKLPLKDSSSTAVPYSARLQIMLEARDEYTAIMDDHRLKTALEVQTAQYPSDPLYNDPVVVYRTTTRKWDGPLRYVGESDHGFYIVTANGETMLFQKPCVRRYAAGINYDALEGPASNISTSNP